MSVKGGNVPVVGQPKDESENAKLLVNPCQAYTLAPGQERPVLDLSLVPTYTGPSERVGFRADTQTAQFINEHWKRMADRAPGAAITCSDAMRSLIAEGARSYRRKFRDVEVNEPSTNGASDDYQETRTTIR